VGWDAVTRKLRSRTGRGLSTALWGEGILLAACLLYLATRSARLFTFGFVIAGVWGFTSVIYMWRGQDEFGPEHHRYARRGTYWFLLAGLLFLLSFASFGTFPAAATDLGGPGTTGAPALHRFKDLVPPVVLFGAAVAAELVSGAHFLWELTGIAWRRWVVMYGSAGVTIGAIGIVVGWTTIRSFERENGLGVASQSGASYYFDLFMIGWLTVMATLLAATRIAAIVLLRHAIAKVAEAESDADGPAAAPPAPDA
jgi:hypothetical protein